MTTVGPVNRPYSGVRLGDLVQNEPGVILRPIVYHHEIRFVYAIENVPLYLFHRCPDGSLLIIGGHDHRQLTLAQGRLNHGGPLPTRPKARVHLGPPASAPEPGPLASALAFDPIVCRRGRRTDQPVLIIVSSVQSHPS